MSGCWPPENNTKHTSSLRDEHHGAMEGSGLSVSEEDVTELSKREIWGVKNMIRPSTVRIAASFDKMMDAVKRRSSQRHQDVNTAIERCFTAFSGRGNDSLSVYQFARRLSVLSMEWSGNFSKEEYLALAQDLSEEDTPGVVTLESFTCAAKTGAVHLPPCWRRKGDESGSRSTTTRGASPEDNDGCRVDKFDEETGVRGGLGAPTARDVGGTAASTEGTLETTLQQAAAKARTSGQDVWKLLDACIRAGLEEAQVDEDDRSPTSDDVAAQIHLGPDVVRKFLSRLDVRVFPSPPSRSPSPRRQPDDTTGEPHQQQHQQQQQQLDEQAADSRSPRHEAHGHSPLSEQREGAGETAAASSFLSVRNAFEARIRGSREGSPARNASVTPPSSSPQFSSAPKAFEGKKTGIQGSQRAKTQAPAPWLTPSQEAPSASGDRYLRAISRDTASVRCRVQFYNQELARTLQEAESLLSRAAAINIRSGESFQQPSRLLPPDIDGSAAARRGLGGSGGGDSSFVAEVGGGMPAANGGGGGGAAGMSSTGPIIAFSRVSPAGRADPSHPRMELVSRPGSTPRALSPSSHSGHEPDPDQGSGRTPREGGSGRGGQRATAGGSRRDSNGDEPKVTVSDRVAKLLLAALDETKANAPPSSSSASPAAAAAERRKIAASPKTACFDPPSVRNGLTGLTADDVDKVLLRVEAATPGAVSSWKSPAGGGRRRPRTGGTDMLTPSTLDRGLATEARGQRRRSMNLSADSIGWFDFEGSAKGILQEVGAQGAAGDGPGARRKKGGGGARRKRSILKIKLPPRIPTTRSKTGGDPGAIQAAPATTGRKGSWGIEHVEWASSVDDDEEDDDDAAAAADAGDFTGSNPMYGRPVETVDEKHIQSRTLPAPPRRGFSFAPRKKRGGFGSTTEGPPGHSPSVSAVRKNSADQAYPYDSSTSATHARFTRRPVRAFQKLDDDVYDGFLNATKKKAKSGRGIRRMGTLS